MCEGWGGWWVESEVIENGGDNDGVNEPIGRDGSKEYVVRNVRE